MISELRSAWSTVKGVIFLPLKSVVKIQRINTSIVVALPVQAKVRMLKFVKRKEILTTRCHFSVIVDYVSYSPKSLIQHIAYIHLMLLVESHLWYQIISCLFC